MYILIPNLHENGPRIGEKIASYRQTIAEVGEITVNPIAPGDTWRDGIHSYLTYLRDRLTVARDLLTDSGSIFVQIGDENVHRVRVLMDEVFGNENFCGQIVFRKTTGKGAQLLD